MSHIVHVVSMLEVMMSLGDRVFQSSEVNGAVCSGVFEFESSARGSNLAGGTSLVFASEDLLILLVTWAGCELGSDHNLR